MYETFLLLGLTREPALQIERRLGHAPPAPWGDPARSIEQLVRRIEAGAQGRPPPGRVLYILLTDDADAHARGCLLGELLRTTSGEASELLVLQPQERREPPWPEAHVHNRYLRRLAPADDPADAHLASWDGIFAEFRLRGASAERGGDAASLLEQGQALLRAGNAAEAETLFRRALAERFDNPLLHHQLGIALAEQGREAEAEAAQRQAIRLSPNNAGFHYRLAMALRAQGRLRESVDAHCQAVAINGQNPVLFEALADGLRALGRAAEAAQIDGRAERLRRPQRPAAA